LKEIVFDRSRTELVETTGIAPVTRCLQGSIAT